MPTAKSMLVPEAWQVSPDMPEETRAMYQYHFVLKGANDKSAKLLL